MTAEKSHDYNNNEDDDSGGGGDDDHNNNNPNEEEAKPEDAETGADDEPDDTTTAGENVKKQRHMTVAADAPWKDRMWEGRYYALYCCWNLRFDRFWFSCLPA